MTPTRFLVGTLSTGEQRWAGVDVNAHHLEGRVCDRRFAAYCAPFQSEAEARAALATAGCQAIEPEAGRRDRRRRGR